MEQVVQSIPSGTDRLMLAALPPGWQSLGRCRFGTGGSIGFACGCHALAHPATGLALVDVAPDVTPNAEARVRRALSAADFWPAFPGSLPVWHGRIEPGQMRSLSAILEDGFGALPPLTVPGKTAWVDAARDAIAEDPAWEVPGRSMRTVVPLVSAVEPERDLPPSPRRLGRLLMGLGVVLLFSLGLAGFVTVVTDVPAPRSVAPIQPVAEAAPAAPVMPSQALARTQAPAPVQEEAPPVQALASAAPRSQPAPPPLPPIEQVTLPVVEPIPVAAPPPPPEPPAATVTRGTLALPPPAPGPPPPIRKVSAPAPRIDPGCSRALFRYQQGLALNAAETAHVRNGCATRR